MRRIVRVVAGFHARRGIRAELTVGSRPRSMQKTYCVRVGNGLDRSAACDAEQIVGLLGK